ncbi:UNVERIFIED_CONTAM: coatomer subunit alpha [Gekko kuhli]
MSIEFDRDCDYFAIAGVTKKIKVYEYGTVIQDAVDIHYPENEMTCNSKIRPFTSSCEAPTYIAGQILDLYFEQA